MRAGVRLAQRGVPLPVGLRRRWLDLWARTVPLPAGTRTSRELAGGIPAVRVEHEGVAGPGTVLYLHGGAYCVGSALTHRGLCARLSRAVGVPVVLLEYRLAPEHPYPAGLDDAVAAFNALADSAGGPGNVAVCGDSAGGGLALAAGMRLRDAGASPAMLGLICPWVDLTCSGESIRRNAFRDAGLSARWVRAGAEHYRAGHDARHPEISPLDADLAGLPPVCLHTAGDDLLFSEGKRLAERLAEAGVELEYRSFEGLWHDFHLTAHLLPEAEAAIAELGSAIRARLGTAS